VLAALAWVLIVAGWTQRRRSRRVHVALALSGIAVDLTLVLILELQRDVVGQTFSKDWSAIQTTHIATSAAAVVLYIPVVILGVLLLRNLAGAKLRKAHAITAMLALFLRTIGFVCMWWI